MSKNPLSCSSDTRAMTSDLLTLPKVLLMGLRKSGKSSIQKVVFEGMQADDTVNLPATVQPEKAAVHSNDFVNFEVWDFPGQNDPFDPNNASRYDADQLLENCGAIVFVMDCRELIDDSRARLLDTVCAAYQYNRDLSIEVFIHKVDALSEDHQTDLLASLQRRVEVEAKQRLENTTPLRLNFNLTSIYDHSVFQAFSLVVQKLIKSQLPYITELLQMLNSNSNVDLSYLFLSKSKIYLAVDERNRVRSLTYDICGDAVEVMVKMEKIYSTTKKEPTSNNELECEAEIGSINATSPPSSNKMFTEMTVGSGAHAIIDLSSEDCIYVKELPNSLTVVMMTKKESLRNRALIDHNISVFYKAALEIFLAASNGS